MWRGGVAVGGSVGRERVFSFPLPAQKRNSTATPSPAAAAAAAAEASEGAAAEEELNAVRRAQASMTAARLLEELEDDDHALARGDGVANSVEGGLVCEAVLLAGAPPGLPRIWPRRTLPRRGARGGHLWRVARRAAGREVAAATARLIKHYSRSGAWVEITPAALAGPRALAATATHRGPHSSPTCLSDAPEPSDCSERLAHLCQESPETRGITQSCVMHALRAGRGAHCASD